MSNDDFFDFLNELGACYPMIAKWFAGQDDSVANKWQGALRPIELAEAKTLLNEWFQSGTQPFKESTQWQEIPSLIRREAINRRLKLTVPDWKKPAYRPSQDSEFVAFSKRMHEVAARYDNGLGSITLEEAQQEHKEILADYDDHVASLRNPSKREFSGT